MVTVKQFKEVGFILEFGDKISNEKFNLIIDCGSVLDAWNENSYIDCKSFIAEVNWRTNKGLQPVDDNLWVEVLYIDGEKDLALAGEFCWGNEDNLTHWKPSLKHLGQQMTDNQETKTALEMSERDIENYADDCEVERELKESDEVVWESGEIAIHEGHEVLVIDWHPHHPLLVVEGGNGFFATSSDKLSKPETPEQKAARERMESAYDLYISCGIQSKNVSFDSFKKENPNAWLDIVDRTGYRKQ